LETRKGRGFPHSHSDDGCGCQIGQNCKTRVNHIFLQILVQNPLLFLQARMKEAHFRDHVSKTPI
jgi:hypothetical protein